MEVIVCILTTLFFAALELWEIKARNSKMARQKHNGKEFVVVPLLRHPPAHHPAEDL